MTKAMAIPEGWPARSVAEVQDLLCAPGMPFEMEVVEIRGVPTRVWKNALPNLATLARLCRLDEAWLIELVEAGLLKPAGPETRPQHWRFDGIQLGRARRAYRLQRDFEASQAALALMMQLLDEVERLQRLVPR